MQKALGDAKALQICEVQDGEPHEEEVPRELQKCPLICMSLLRDYSYICTFWVKVKIILYNTMFVFWALMLMS